VLDVRDMLGVASNAINEFVRIKGSAFLPGLSPKWTPQYEEELVNLTAAHMGTISAVFPHWFEDTEQMASERRAFLKLTVADLSSSLIEQLSNRESLKAFLPQLASQTVSAPPNPTLILTGRRATHRVGLACPEARLGDIVCQFVHSEGAILIRLNGSSSQIIGKATMMKQRLCEETPSHPLTGQKFTFSAVSQEGLRRTTQLQWRLHPLDLVGWEGRESLVAPSVKPPKGKVG